jgi:FkbM family methyltransferase
LPNPTFTLVPNAGRSGHFPLRLAPLWLRTKLYYRFYRGKNRHPNLFHGAPLEFAPGVQMDLHPTDEGHGQIAFTGFYELALTRRIVQLARQGGLLADVGANYGYFSLLWAAQKPGNRVVAFEASPRNLVPLRANISRNGFDSPIEVRPMAAGRESGSMEFDQGPENQTGWGGVVLSGNSGPTIPVPVVRLDESLAAERFIDVMKIDIEGADTWALMGASALLRDKRIGRIFYEENTTRMRELGISPGEAESFLKSLGYRVRRLDGGPGTAVSEFEAFPAV